MILEIKVKKLEDEVRELKLILGQVISWLPGGINSEHARTLLNLLEKNEDPNRSKYIRKCK